MEKEKAVGILQSVWLDRKFSKDTRISTSQRMHFGKGFIFILLHTLHVAGNPLFVT